MNAEITGAPELVRGWQEFTWGILTAGIFLSWWALFAKRLAVDFSLTERLLAAFILSVSQIVLTTILLGFLHMLGWWELGAFNAAIVIGVFIFSSRLKMGRGMDDEIGLGLKALYRMCRSSTAFFLLALFGTLIFLWHSFFGQLLPSIGWDSWGYHLPWAAIAHQEHYLGPFEFPLFWINYFPKNTDILFLWSIVGCGTDRWANIAQGPFALAAVLACYILGRRAGAGRSQAAVAALLVLSIPIVLRQIGIAYVDLALMGAAMSSLAFLARRNLNFVACLLAGLAAGFMVGTKGTGFYNLVGLSVLLIYRFFPLGMDGIGNPVRSRLRFAAVSVLVFFGFTFMMSGYYYIKNWVIWGNPTGNYEVEIAGITIFEGERTVEQTHFHQGLISPKVYEAIRNGSEWPVVFDGFFDPEVYYTQANRMGGWGAAWTILVLPSIPIAFIFALTRRNWAFIAIILSVLLSYFAFTLNHTWIRYHMPVIAVGITSFAYWLSVIKSVRLQRFFEMTAVVLMIYSALVSAVPSPWVASPQDISQCRLVPYQGNYRFLFFDSWKDRAFGAALLSVEDHGMTLALGDWMPEDKNLAAWNAYFTNRVVWVGWGGDGDSWTRELIDENADAVFVNCQNPAYNWASEHPGNFELIRKNDNLGAIFKVLKPDGAAASNLE